MIKRRLDSGFEKDGELRFRKKKDPPSQTEDGAPKVKKRNRKRNGGPEQIKSAFEASSQILSRPPALDRI
jgi:hypothetical protein